MYAKKSLVVVIVLFQISCMGLADKTYVNPEKDVSVVSPTPLTSPKQSKVEPTEMEKMVIYWSALSRVYADDEHDKILGSINNGDLVYKIEAVSPEGIEQIENNQAISKSLINNFKEANQTPKKLLDEYPVKQPILGQTGSRELTKFYEEAKRKNPKTKAVVCFSNVGIDNTYSETLVYGEYYRPDQKLIKFYLLMKMDKLQSVINDSSFAGVESFSLIKLN